MASTHDAVSSRSGQPSSTSSSDMVREVLGQVGIAAYRWDITSDRLEWSADAEALFSVVSIDEISTGRRYARFIDPAGPPGRHDAVMRGAARSPGGEGRYSVDYCFRPAGAPDNGGRWVVDNGRWVAGPDGVPVRAEGVVRVDNERRARNELLIYRSDHDELTGGFNRTRLVEVLAQALEDAQRDNGVCALAILAIDNLGPLNDAYGFDVGDELVAGVAARLATSTRAGDALGRLSGNKIGIVLHTCGDAELKAAAKRFACAVGEAPIETTAGAIAVSISMGGVVLPRYGRVVGEALARAQEALAEARRAGTTGMTIFEPRRGREVERQQNIALAGEIVAALNDGRFGLAFQPMVRAKDGSLFFYEALCRLTLEDGSPISAGNFIEVAERLGIIRMVDHRVLDLAIAALIAEPELMLSINVSTASALDGGWFARLAAHLRQDRDLSSRLMVEITETMAIDDLSRAVDFVRSLRDIGCHVAIDDFGSGHTSFRNLRALEADIVKIDGSFIENIAENPDDQFFVGTLARLARHMGLETVAERVSCERDAEFLKAAGIDYLQGHLFGEASQNPLKDAQIGSASA